jgi:hypothetical protein
MMRAEEGEMTRVLDAAQVRDLERRHPLPELVIIGDSLLYEIVYTGSGTLDGAFLSTDPQLIKEASTELADLFRGAEDLGSFFSREVAPLPPPAGIG